MLVPIARLRTYQQFIEDALDTILHGKPAGGGDGALKRAFSTSSESVALDAAAAALAVTAGAPAAAVAASAVLAAPLATGSPAATAASPAAAAAAAGADAPAVKRSVSSKSAPAAAETAAAPAADAPAGGDGGDSATGSSGAAAAPRAAPPAADKPELLPVAEIAAEVYGLHVGGEAATGGGGGQPDGDAGAAEAAADVAADVGDRVLLCEERLDFLCNVEESPGMPWARAKFQVYLPSNENLVLLDFEAYRAPRLSLLCLFGNTSEGANACVRHRMTRRSLGALCLGLLACLPACLLACLPACLALGSIGPFPLNPSVVNPRACLHPAGRGVLCAAVCGAAAAQRRGRRGGVRGQPVALPQVGLLGRQVQRLLCKIPRRALHREAAVALGEGAFLCSMSCASCFLLVKAGLQNLYCIAAS